MFRWIRTRAPRVLFGLMRTAFFGLLFLVAALSVALGAATTALIIRARRPATSSTSESTAGSGVAMGERPEPRGWTRTTIFRLLMLLVTLSTAIGIVGAAVLIAPRAAVMGLFSEDEPIVTVAGGDVEAGQDALRAYGCISCHTVPGVSGSFRATVGPPLTGWAEREYIAGSLANTPENLLVWIQDPQAIEPGTVMPTLGVTEQDARDIAAYLYTLED